MTNYYLAIFSDIDATQRTLIHSEVKVISDEWWHEIPDVWVLRSDLSAHQLMTRLQVFVPLSPSLLLVFLLPKEGQRTWAARGNKDKWSWLWGHYAHPGGGAAQPTIEP